MLGKKKFVLIMQYGRKFKSKEKCPHLGEGKNGILMEI